MIIIPQDFIDKTVSRKGREGQQWLDSLTDVVGRLAVKWNLKIRDTFSNLSYNFVVNVENADGSTAVLKVGWKTDKEFKFEYDSLKIFDGHGIARVLEYSDAEPAMLLEKLEPGKMLSLIEDDEEATEIAAKVMKELWQEVPSNYSFPSVGDWGLEFARIRDRFGGTSGPLPKEIFNKAEDLYKNLVASQEKTVLLHGDLHHYNILSAKREAWLAIDPKGLIGEPAYETGSYLRNPIPELLERSNQKEMFRKRVAIFTDLLGMNRERVVGWAYSQAVLSACWCVSENEKEDTWKFFIRCAEIFDSI